jgi:hypothetical protein
MFPSVIPNFRAGHLRVTHPSAADGPRRSLIARLACIKRAASVHPEPRSNSPFDLPQLIRVTGFFSRVLLSLLAVSCYYSAVKVPCPSPTVKPMPVLFPALRIGLGNFRTCSTRCSACRSSRQHSCYHTSGSLSSAREVSLTLALAVPRGS